MIVSLSDAVLDYFAPNTNITYVNFKPIELAQKVTTHALNHKGQFEVNYGENDIQTTIKAELEPCRLSTNNEMCKAYIRKVYPSIGKIKSKTLKSVALADITTKDKNGILAVATSTYDKEALKVKAASYLAKIRAKHEKEEHRSKSKTKSSRKSRQRSVSKQRDERLISGNKRSYKSFQEESTRKHNESYRSNYKRRRNESNDYKILESEDKHNSNQEFSKYYKKEEIKRNDSYYNTQMKPNVQQMNQVDQHYTMYPNRRVSREDSQEIRQRLEPSLQSYQTNTRVQIPQQMYQN